VATSGAFQWPPMGSFPWPPSSVDLTGCNNTTNGDITRRGTSQFIADVKLATGGGILPKMWQAPRPLQFRPTFQRVAGASGPQLPSSDGGYVAIQQADGVDLIDEHTNASTVLTVPDCSQPVSGPQLAGPWLAETCPGVPSGIYETFVENLYSLATGQWRTIAVPAGDCVSDGDYGESGGTECELGPVGADWLGWTENCWNCGSQTGLFYLGPGQQPISSLPDTSTTTVLDYNSPTLETALCSPLRDTATNHLIVNAAGQFIADETPLGSYALANRRHGVYLERCGSRLDRQLPDYPVTGNSSELLFDQSSPNVTGLFLPSMRKFVIHFPKAVLTQQLAGPGKTVEVLEGIRLSARHLYILGPDDEIWAASAPTPPR
jgi:hypothetical protein